MQEKKIEIFFLPLFLELNISVLSLQSNEQLLTTTKRKRPESSTLLIKGKKM